MKILVFMENNQYGGLDTFSSTLLNAWPDSDDHFVFICNASHPGIHVLQTSIKRPCDFIAHELPLSWVVSKQLFGWLPVTLRRASQPFIRIFLYVIQYHGLFNIFKKLDGDALLVVNGGFPGGESCRIANIAWYKLMGSEFSARNIHNFHNFAVPPRFGFGIYENWIDRKLSKVTGNIISVSRTCADSLRDNRTTFQNSDAIGYIYNGIYPEVDCNNLFLNLRTHLDIGNKPLCLMLANYESRKGHQFLFNAFANVARHIPEAHLVICGGGTHEEKSEVESLRNAYAPHANIHLLDFVPDGHCLIKQADLLLISSQYFESFGLTAVEAMIRSVPIVATRVGGLPEVVGELGEGGYLIDPHDISSFASKIIELIGDPHLRSEVGVHGRQRAKRLFTASRMARQYRNILKKRLL
jgi:L-malate glycosyltransferase